VRERRGYTAELPGPPHPRRADAGPLTVRLRFVAEGGGDAGVLRFPGGRIRLVRGRASPWIRLAFRAGRGARVTGICRVLLCSVSPHVCLYVTPIQIDPARPVLPLSHPFAYAAYLAGVFGDYATLGLAEDTWAVNEGVIDGPAFLEQTWEIQEARERHFFDALAKVRRGLVAAVFDFTDRVQHMFWRGTPEGGGEGDTGGAVEEAYRRADDLVGRVRRRLGPDDVLMVVSDHGFASFRQGVNVNAWLRANGFLALKEGPDSCGDSFADVDWSRTRAYALGLGGIFLNRKGRESRGIVAPGPEAEAVKKEIAEGLAGLAEGDGEARVVRRVFDGAEIYGGPYAENAPDLVVGFAEGYRMSWDSVVGRFGTSVIEPNEKAWGGDHGVDPDLVPGVLFCDRPVAEARPGIVDIAPTVLELLGVRVPAYMDGRALGVGAPR
jgi:predicted AlkP superfamily phosphohydrolase/phosphomutase